MLTCVLVVSWCLSWIRKKMEKKLSNYLKELLQCLLIPINMDFHQKVPQSVCFQTKSTETATFLQLFTGPVDFMVLLGSLAVDQEPQSQPAGLV